MSFTRINGSQMIFEISAFDETGRKVDKFRVNKSDVGKVMKTLNYKYNLGFRIIDTKKADDKDLDWLK